MIKLKTFNRYMIFMSWILLASEGCKHPPFQPESIENPPDKSAIHCVSGTIELSPPITIYLSSLERDCQKIESTDNAFYFDGLVNGRTYIITPVLESNREFEIGMPPSTNTEEGFYAFQYQGKEISLKITSKENNNNHQGKMIDFNLKDQNGNNYRIYDRYHKLTLVVFVAWWCPHSNYAEIERFYQGHRNSGVQVWIIADDLPKVLKVISDNNIHISYPIISGDPATLNNLFNSYNPYGSSFVPFFVLLDKNINQIWTGSWIGSDIEIRLLYHL